MTMSVRLDPKTERLVERLAKKRSQPKSAVIREAIEVLAAREEGELAPTNARQAISDLIGCVRGGPPDASSQTGRRFTERLRAAQGTRRSKR